MADDDFNSMDLKIILSQKILIMGLPGAGKTTLSIALKKRIHCVHYNADEVRKNIFPDIGFSIVDRVTQARRMSWLCDQVIETGLNAIADFICPIPSTREAFNPTFIIWVDRISSSRYPDTDKIFVIPELYDIRITSDGGPEEWCDRIIKSLTRPTR